MASVEPFGLPARIGVARAFIEAFFERARRRHVAALRASQGSSLRGQLLSHSGKHPIGLAILATRRDPTSSLANHMLGLYRSFPSNHTASNRLSGPSFLLLPAGEPATNWMTSFEWDHWSRMDQWRRSELRSGNVSS